MIEITQEQIDRVREILSEVPNGLEKALRSVIQRANSTVRTETVNQITSVYAISRQNVRAETNIKTKIQTIDGGIVGTITFAGYKIPLYRYSVTPTVPTQGATVKAKMLKSNSQTPFVHAFIARMKNTGHTGIFERERKERLPVKEIMGLSTATMADNSVVLEKVEEKVQDTINKRIEHEVTRILNGYGR